MKSSGFGPCASRLVDSRAGTGCGLLEGCSNRRGGGAPCGAPRSVGGWCWLHHWAPRGKQARARTRRAVPGIWQPAVSGATPTRLLPHASAKAPVVTVSIFARRRARLISRPARGTANPLSRLGSAVPPSTGLGASRGARPTGRVKNAPTRLSLMIASRGRCDVALFSRLGGRVSSQSRYSP